MRSWMAAAALALAACDGPADSDTGTIDPLAAPLVGAEDGAYVVGFQRGGQHFALGQFTIERNVVEGSVRSSDGVDVTIEATVQNDGSLRVDDVSSSGTQAMSLVEGRVAAGILEGSYTVDGETGTFAGRRTTGLVAAPTTDFDGQYEVATILEGEETTATVASVRAGAVTATVVDVDGATTDVRGFVTSDGTFVLVEAVQSTGEPVLAEASIDHDSFDVVGVFRSGDHVGRIVGRRAD